MPTNNPKPRLAESAALIQQAMELKGLTHRQVARQLGLSDKTGSTVWNWMTGRNAPSPMFRDKLAKLLDLDVSEVAPRDTGITGRPKKKARPKAKPGPAAQAVALYTQHAEVHAPVLTAPRAAPAAADLFTATIRADGTMRIKLDLWLDLAKGMALTQTLFAAGVLLSQDKDEDDRAPIPHDVVEGQS
jgi:transcriptional regulator with XRE-family HTH domain